MDAECRFARIDPGRDEAGGGRSEEGGRREE
jgi:hypothetical protein